MKLNKHYETRVYKALNGIHKNIKNVLQKFQGRLNSIGSNLSLLKYLVPFYTILHLIAVWILQAIELLEWSKQLPSFLAFCVSKRRAGRSNFKYFPKNALLSFCHNMKSANHVPYVVYLILPCSALACTHNFKNFLSSIQVFCCKTFTLLWYDVSYRSLCVQSSMSSPLHHLSYCHESHECAHLSPSTCKPLFMFLHLVLRCPSSYCIPHAIIKCRTCYDLAPTLL